MIYIRLGWVTYLLVSDTAPSTQVILISQNVQVILIFTFISQHFLEYPFLHVIIVVPQIIFNLEYIHDGDLETALPHCVISLLIPFEEDVCTFLIFSYSFIDQQLLLKQFCSNRLSFWDSLLTSTAGAALLGWIGCAG